MNHLPKGSTTSVIRHSSFVIRHSSFVIRHSSFVIRHSSFVIRHSSFLICLGLILLIHSTSYGQTPPPCPIAPPPISIPYALSYCYHFTLPSGCGVEVCWCERTIGTYPDLAITSITPDPGPLCDNMNWKDIITQSNTALLQYRIGGSNHPPCDGPAGDTISTSLGLCSYFSVTYDAYKMSMCINGGWCQTIYTVCTNLGSKWISKVSQVYIPGDCNVPYPADGHPTLGQCYQTFTGCP
jgi:hypothetical protein